VEGVEVLRGDLRERGTWVRELSSIEAVIHLAASPSGDLHTQLMGTVVATENLLDHLPLASLQRFVHVSSFSVYDFKAIRSGRVLDENSPLEERADERDAYTTTKILQEKIVRTACAAAATSLVVIRPGAIYGPGKDWNHGRALVTGRFDFLFSPGARMRLTHVENCSDAIVNALTADVPPGATFNIVDDDVPSHRQFYKATIRPGVRKSLPLYVPWFVVSMAGYAAQLSSRLFFKGRAKLPELLALRRQHARWKPITYSNTRAKEALGWKPKLNVKEGVASLRVER
jgi:nucleoside-diphosphate-sugar epimerase